VSADIFISALTFTGTFGILTLFGIIPAAMVWTERYGDSTVSHVQLVPGGRPALLLVGGIAAGIIGREVLLSTGLM
jgi:tyrosine-specific transport protein